MNLKIFKEKKIMKSKIVKRSLKPNYGHSSSMDNFTTSIS